MAASVEVAPPGFRDGATWPYRPGPVVDALLARIRQLPASQLRRPKNLAGINHLVFWRDLEDDDAPATQIKGFELAHAKPSARATCGLG